MKKAFMCVVNKNYLFALGALIMNLKNKNILYDNLIVYASDVNESLKKSFICIEPRLLFIDYDINSFKDEFLDGGELLDVASSFVKRYTYLSYLKFKIFTHLNNFETIVFVDLDTVILDDISELFKIDCNIAWRNGDVYKNKVSAIKTRCSKNSLLLGELNLLPDDLLTPNGGLLVVNNNFDYEKAYEVGKNFLRKYIQYATVGIDELIFTYVAYVNKLRLFSLDVSIYNTPPHIYIQ